MVALFFHKPILPVQVVPPYIRYTCQDEAMCIKRLVIGVKFKVLPGSQITNVCVFTLCVSLYFSPITNMKQMLFWRSA